MKLLMWLAVIGLVAAALYVRRSPANARSAGQPAAKPLFRNDAEIVLPCAHCGVYFPASEALHQGDLSYCCQDHLGKPASH